LKWLQQNNAEEDRRTGYVPTERDRRERADVSAKSLYCVIPPAQHKIFQDHSTFVQSFFPFASVVVQQPQTTDKSKVAVQTPTATVLDCPKCPVCPTCPVAAAPAPAPLPAPVPLASGTVRSERRIISFGLYGSNPKYVHGAFRNAELTPSVFPGWTMRVYHDDSVPQSARDTLTGLGCELVHMPREAGSIAGMFWRFLVADDTSVDRYIVRDSDSRLHEREARAVDAWIASGKCYHILRDHPSHSQATVSGGLWGGCRDPTLHIAEKMKTHNNKDQYVEDMHFLGGKVYPHMLKVGVIGKGRGARWSC
jgi:hypothetical protein